MHRRQSAISANTSPSLGHYAAGRPGLAVTRTRNRLDRAVVETSRGGRLRARQMATAAHIDRSSTGRPPAGTGAVIRPELRTRPRAEVETHATRAAPIVLSRRRTTAPEARAVLRRNMGPGQGIRLSATTGVPLYSFWPVDRVRARHFGAPGSMSAQPGLRRQHSSLVGLATSSVWHMATAPSLGCTASRLSRLEPAIPGWRWLVVVLMLEG